MVEFLQIVAALCTIFLVVVGLACFLWRNLKKSYAPEQQAVKWAVTLVMVAPMAYLYWGQDISFASVMGVIFSVPIAFVISYLWAPDIGRFFASWITGAIDGGDTEIEPAPLYSPAIYQRKKGEIQQALWEIQAQLEKFPNDYTGMMMIAEIQAEDLKDVEAATGTVKKVCAVEGLSNAQVADALNRLADWQLKLSEDQELVRQTFEEIRQRFPNSPFAHLAAQRMSHLCVAKEQPVEALRQPLHLPSVPDDPKRLFTDPEAQRQVDEKSNDELIVRLVDDLVQYPENNEARERLAALYAFHCRNLELASAQLEQLINQPHAPYTNTVRWLNQLADYQVELGSDEETVRATVQRIIDIFPDKPTAEVARQRLELLGNEFKKKQSAARLKIGVYEQDIGLKKRARPGEQGE